MEYYKEVNFNKKNEPTEGVKLSPTPLTPQ